MNTARPESRFCPHCQRPYQFGRENCSWCGHSLPADPTDDVEARCPACQEILEVQTDQEIPMHTCPQCWGVWLSLTVIKGFERLYEKVTPIRPLAAEGSPTPQGHVEGLREFNQRQAYRRCPVCRQEMARRRYHRVSNFVVDRCMAHGIWFDPGEFDMAVEFLRQGGLERGRRADEQIETSLGGYAALQETIGRFRTMYYLHILT
jgi:Zn-finger nucleic acid-binding protein